jgi:hypothetical protein
MIFNQGAFMGTRKMLKDLSEVVNKLLEENRLCNDCSKCVENCEYLDKKDIKWLCDRRKERVKNKLFLASIKLAEIGNIQSP